MPHQGCDQPDPRGKRTKKKIADPKERDVKPPVKQQEPASKPIAPTRQNGNGGKRSKYDLKSVQDEIIKNDVKAQLVEEKDEEYQVFSKEDFLNAWNDYIENHVKNKSNNLYAALTGNQINIADGRVELFFENKALEDLFIQEKLKLSDFLLENYKIKNIRFVTRIKPRPAEETTKYITNPKEKYEIMLKTNPKLALLQEKLGLQPNE